MDRYWDDFDKAELMIRKQNFKAFIRGFMIGYFISLLIKFLWLNYF